MAGAGAGRASRTDEARLQVRLLCISRVVRVRIARSESVEALLRTYGGSLDEGGTAGERAERGGGGVVGDVGLIPQVQPVLHVLRLELARGAEHAARAPEARLTCDGHEGGTGRAKFGVELEDERLVGDDARPPEQCQQSGEQRGDLDAHRSERVAWGWDRWDE